uniref:Glyoxylate reductase/hydroxypyruvate reductase isoform X2 n=1 Tax=Rhizophora mucronata TaxID=61149 RepID=A0A2P2JRL1_RHIMU
MLCCSMNINTFQTNTKLHYKLHLTCTRYNSRI